MRKIIILLPLLVLLFGFISQCASQEDIATMKNGFNSHFNATMSDSVASQIVDKWQTSGKTYCWIWRGSSNNIQVYMANGYTVNGGNIFPTSPYLMSNEINANGSSTFTWQNYSGSYVSGNSQYTWSVGTWDDFHTIPIDWEHPYYSVAIPTPEYDVTYRKVGLGVDVPLNFTFNAPLEGEYYVEIMAEFALADYLTFMPVSRYFEASSYSYVTKEIVNPNQFISASDITANTLHTVLTNMWQAALNEVPLSSVSIKFPTDFTAQEILDWRDGYNELRETCGTAGTSIKFYARYFQIVDDTKFVVGPWRIWNSVSPKTFNDELPSYYLPYAIASGNTGTSTSTSSDPDDVYIPVGGDNPTGEYYSPSFNITVGNNVPNYPDYPTIASYNMDNLLVSTMNNAKGLTSFFGEFGGFLTASFAFIPSWIWAIIGVGFGLSIVVMFLKIL